VRFRAPGPGRVVIELPGFDCDPAGCERPDRDRPDTVAFSARFRPQQLFVLHRKKHLA
jgi:hypothetical protein